MPATSDLYHQDYHAWIAGQAALLRQGRTHEIDPELLADAINESYPDARHIASQETGIRAAAFPGDCPYRDSDILDERYWPGDARG